MDFGDLRGLLSKLIHLWPSIRPFVRYTGMSHAKDTAIDVGITMFFLFQDSWDVMILYYSIWSSGVLIGILSLTIWSSIDSNCCDLSLTLVSIFLFGVLCLFFVF